ncbi:MAG: phosphoribosylanthranilate isomerase [Dysgonomonas sp.]
MKIKVCGMKYPDNIHELGKLPIDYMGFIIYSKSPRYLLDPNLGSENFTEDRLTEKRDLLDTIPSHIKKVGVVVNDIPNLVISYIKDFGMDCIQLHGMENHFFCEFIREKSPGTEIIKAISVSEASDLERTKKYTKDDCDYFLFDTKTPQHGGSGQKFDWNILNSYNGDIPFFLSGGISIDDANTINGIKHPQLYGLDLNSKFEIEPGLKDIELLNQFIQQLKYE